MRTVFCQKYQQELPGLDRPPFPGPKGEHIFSQVSAQAWQDWLAQQTRLINEKRLNMMEPRTREYLQQQMALFLAGEDFDQAEGYVPEK